MKEIEYYKNGIIDLMKDPKLKKKDNYENFFDPTYKGLDFKRKMKLKDGRYWNARFQSGDFYRAQAAYYVITFYNKINDEWKAIKKFGVRVHSTGCYSKKARAEILSFLKGAILSEETNIPSDVHWKGGCNQEDIDQL